MSYCKTHGTNSPCVACETTRVVNAINDLKIELGKLQNISSIQQDMRDKPLADRIHPVVDRSKPRNKYDREIVPGVFVDVYDVLSAFKVTSAAIAHAIKKLLAPGQRGVKDCRQDVAEARDSLDREIQSLDEWV